MKFAFSTADVKAQSFLALCNKTAEYGFSAFEIADPRAELTAHEDSIFHAVKTAGAKLINRHIAICALRYAGTVRGEQDGEGVLECVELAATANCPCVVITVDNAVQNEVLIKSLTPAVKRAEERGVMLLVETVGSFAKTK